MGGLSADEADFVESVTGGDLLGEMFGMVFVEGVDPAAALGRCGSRPGTMRQRTLDEFLVLAGDTDGRLDPRPIALAAALPGWSVVLGTYEVADEERVTAVSWGCRAVGVMRHDYAASHAFSYAVDGELIAAFPPEAVWRRYGADPDRLAAEMAAVGLRLDDDEGPPQPVAAALRLAGRLTGRLPTRAGLVGRLPTADLADAG